MKQRLLILAACVVVLLCLGFAVATANTHQANVQAAQNAQVKKAQDTLKQHDAVNTANLKNAGDRIIQLTQDKTTLCTQIKAARLTQPLCQ